MRKHFWLSIIIFLIIFAYAVIRYNVIKGTPWSELPFFVSNKAISLAAVVFIALSYALGSGARFWPKTFSRALDSRKFFGLLGFGLAAIHGLISLLILTPASYPKFFLENGKLNSTGELSLFFGVLALSVFTLVAISSIPIIEKSIKPSHWHTVQHLGYLGLVLVLLHVFTMGIEGWLKPAGWPGGLLPISLVASILIVLVLLLKITAVIFSKNGTDKR